MMNAYRVDRATQSKDDVTPALSARWPIIELSEELARFRLFRMTLGDSLAGQSVKHAELFLPKPFVGDEFGIVGKRKTARLPDQLAGLLRPAERRAYDNVRPKRLRLRLEPSPERHGLLPPEVAQRHVDIAHIDRNLRQAGSVSGVARDVPRTLAVPHDPQSLRPTFLHNPLS